MGFKALNHSLQLTKQAFFRSYTSALISAKPFKPSSFVNYRPLFALADKIITRTSSTVRCYSSSPASPTDWSSRPNWTKDRSNRPIDGCDFEHWLIMLDRPAEGTSREQIIDTYIKTLAQVVGSEEEARMKIYSVSAKYYYAFGAFVSQELSNKVKEIPNVRQVLPDSYLDVKKRYYGGEPFINGMAVPYDPKYHEEWVRNSVGYKERNTGKQRPRQNYRLSQPRQRQNYSLSQPQTTADEISSSKEILCRIRSVLLLLLQTWAATAAAFMIKILSYMFYPLLYSTLFFLGFYFFILRLF